jgi:hypothetical protein
MLELADLLASICPSLYPSFSRLHTYFGNERRYVHNYFPNTYVSYLLYTIYWTFCYYLIVWIFYIIALSLNSTVWNFIDRSTHFGNLFVPVGSTEQCNKMAVIYEGSVFVVKTVYSMVNLVLLLRDNIVESSCSCCTHRQETLFPGLLKGPKKQEVCMINVRGDVNVTHPSVREKLSVQQWWEWQEAQEQVCNL